MQEAQEATRRRPASIHSQMRRIVAIPMVVLLLVWLVVSGVLFTRATVQHAMANAADDLLIPASLALSAVMDERSTTVSYLHAPDDYRAQLSEDRSTVDTSMETVLEELDALRPLLSDAIVERVDELDEQVAGLPELRDQIDRGDVDRDGALAAYTEVTQAGAELFDVQSREGRHPPSAMAGLTAAQQFYALDQLSLADARVTDALATGELAPEDHAAFAAHMGSFHNRVDTVTEHLGPEQAEAWDTLVASSVWAQFRDLEESVISRDVEIDTDPITGESSMSTTPPITDSAWRSAVDPVKEEITEIGADQAGYAVTVSRSSANQQLLTAVGTSLAILAVFTAALILARRMGLHLVNRLVTLRDQTTDLAENRLPDIVRRLSSGDRVNIDLDTELPDLRQDSDDEVGQVAGAFNTAQHTAVAAATQQSELRHGANRAYASIANRSLAVTQRQLRLLDKMEREQEEPQHLTDLFKLDHLATRSRRNAENLLLLGGENPGARRVRPMQLLDVVRAAISESGEYSRIERQQVSALSLRGDAVSDVIHLLAELLDNATTYSPPHTKVRLAAEQVPNGVVVEIEDRGIGMREEELAQTNELLGHKPEFDLLHLREDMRLGLFVVAWLAHRHGIRVQLRPSAYGGILAVVLLPVELLDAQPPAALERGSATDASAAPPTDHSDPDAAAATAPEESEPAATPGTGSADSGATAHPPTANSTGTSRTDGAATGAESHPRPEAPAHSAEAGDTGTDSGAAPSPGRPPLPRRNPQANLNPKLAPSSAHPGANGEVSAVSTASAASAPSAMAETEQASVAPDDSAHPVDSARTNTDEETERMRSIRERLAAFQQGTRQGRADFGPPPTELPTEDTS
ncbi:nitrate- and nitrite sensing domain-containing protein [Lipingzhangella sp. LS1_29]|uniref:histidine kinase n=1 Tax=Lipingzhangella rawalii TaxID=2055835 RepID=A0ABU2H7R0_9ACTN|nr:nitrate- and nitrite sensing domain-containing protein [Lipingzhangella rawalii]MDS1271351.1 nitrate- and nitrite sensing domain-containing protein [Lipingzhangella rawalii]